MKIKAEATKTHEIRTWESYEEFAKDFRFFCSSGARFEGGAEDNFNKIVNTLENLDLYVCELSMVYGGLKITFIKQSEKL